MSDTSLRFNFLEGRNTVIPAAGKTAAAVAAMDRAVAASGGRSAAASRARTQELFRIDNALRNSARRMASHALLIGGALAAVAGHAVALTGSLWPLVGALGAIPAVSVGAVAGLAALITGFVGLGAAMRKTGGGAGVSAEQIISAERRIERAHRGLRDAQNDLNDAFEEASDRLRDIQTSYAGAQLDVEGAALAVRDAELALREARSSGDRQERARAELALRQARLGQVEAANRLSDVEQEYLERMAAGVDGSEEVRTATERQADALYELAEAQRALDAAMRGSGGGGNDAYAKLSQSGKDLVDTLRSLGPEWRKVQQATQQALFAGVAGDVRLLSERYLPVMRANLPAIAQGWNNMFRGISATASQQGFVRDMDMSLARMAVLWQRIGSAFGPFVSGFRHWVAVGSEFLPRLGSWTERIAMRFDLWSLRVRQTGEAFRWIENALVVGSKWNELIKSWGRSIFEVFRLGQDKRLLDNLIAGSQAFERWLSTAQGQERIAQMWARMRDVGSALWRVITQIASILAQMDVAPLALMFNILADALGIVAANMSWLNIVLGPLVVALVSLKVAGLAGALALKALTAASRLFGTQLARETAVTQVNTFAKNQNAAASRGLAGAFSRIENALGPLALAFIAADAAGTLFLDKWLGIGPMTGRLIGQTDQLNASVRVTAEQYAIASQELQTWTDLLKSQTDPVWGFIEAQEQAAAAQQRVNETAAEYGEGSAQHMQAVRDLQRAIMNLNSASAAAAEVDETLLIPQLQQMERQGLLAAGSAQAIADALALAKTRAKELDGTTSNVNVNYRINHDNYYAAYGAHVARQQIANMHSGGIVPGRAGEEVAAVLQRGEMVVPYDQVQKQMAGGGSSGPQRVIVEFDFRGLADSKLAQALKKITRVRGGDTQTAFGTAR